VILDELIMMTKGMLPMYDKKCVISLRIEKLKVLDYRLPYTDLRKVEVMNDYNSRMIGYHGEKSLEFYLEPLIQSADFHVFHDIRLKLGDYYFQIDYLILCNKFGLILEVKNRSKDWCFGPFNQASQLNNGKKEKTQNPVSQAKLQARKLIRWLKENHCEEFPIHYLFVNANEKSKIIFEEGNDQKKNICNSEGLYDKIEQIDNFYKEELLTKKDLWKIKNLLLANHTPDDIDILEYFNLSLKNLLPGVQCPKCNCIPMKYHYGVWTCCHCKEKSKTAHIKAIEEYFLLIKPSITNSELRYFLQINSIKIANTILTSLKLPFSGKFKDRVYYKSLTL
jgi:hypothetical protein